MQRILEILLGLEKGFLSRQGDFSLNFNPQWPWQATTGAAMWNLLLIAIAVALVVWVYRRDGRSRPMRISLGIIRALLLGFVIALLNRPVLTLGQNRVEPSVLAILIDDSVSMRLRDAGEPKAPVSRLETIQSLLSDSNNKLLGELSKRHSIRFYRFDTTAQPVANDQKSLPDALKKIQPVGQNTQVEKSVRAVMEDLQGQRLAGVVVFTDGRDTPSAPLADTLAALKDFGAKVFPVPVGSEKAPTNIDIQSISVQDSAFKGDIVNVKVLVRGTGYEPNHEVTLTLKDKKSGKPLTAPSGSSGSGVEQRVTLPDDKPVEVELQFKADDIGPLDLVVEAQKQPAETDDEDNVRTAQMTVLDAKINVLYVDGYPRWEYRYIKNEMIRDKTIEISCLLTSADPTFHQEGDRPDSAQSFPESIEKLMEYDVVLFGDVDPRQFSDSQLQLVNDFVAKKGGGFGMVAGPRWSPGQFKGTPIEAILPVAITRVEGEENRGPISQGFRLALTKAGTDSSIFRFFPDRAINEKFLRDDIQPIFWYCKGVSVKPGVGEAYAEHPTESGPDGRRAPILVLGRFGGGRTLFSAIDDSWRWRFYTGESVFDTYWVQQVRYLARSKKLGQRRLTLTSSRPNYELGEQVRLNLRVLDPQLLQQLPEQIRVDIVEDETSPGTTQPASAESRTSSGTLTRQETLVRQEGQTDLYAASFTADRIGRFVAKLPPIAGGVDALDLPIEVIVPRLELSQPQVDRAALSRLASETQGQVVDLAQAADRLPWLLPSAAKIIPMDINRPLWDAPLAMILFVFLITTEWVLRKLYGML
jgi:uncharacterized membrane protein